jgi:hypothetical protein
VFISSFNIHLFNFPLLYHAVLSVVLYQISRIECRKCKYLFNFPLCPGDDTLSAVLLLMYIAKPFNFPLCPCDDTRSAVLLLMYIAKPFNFPLCPGDDTLSAVLLLMYIAEPV